MCVERGVGHSGCRCRPLFRMLGESFCLAWVGVCCVVGVVCVQRVLRGTAVCCCGVVAVSRAVSARRGLRAERHLLWSRHLNALRGGRTLIESAAWSWRGAFAIFDSVYCVMCVWD
jgi:hypothetical protein